ncbi:hypothetical protein E4U42_005056 [Claviceps africana]|uniref:Uncharacterized protein n=1 Tax=Claviceps africana TaxID=83212 RepID=A0A8K0J586_9HYPO|nr:hypothetical protein E4U42_005056 [Claviceps africana]
MGETQLRDSQGEVRTTDEVPSAETLAKVETYRVLDGHGGSRPFGTLYRGKDATRRTLVIFIRHFYCGNCQEYLRAVAESITPEALAAIPLSTSIVVIGCGDPALVDSYAKTTNWPYAIFTDPSGSLFHELGMTKTLALGSKPAYMRRSMVVSTLLSIGQALRAVSQGLALSSGDQRQVGGEFLFEPLDVAMPARGQLDEDDGELVRGAEEKRLTWCHRMRTTRDHAEIPVLRGVLGLEGPWGADSGSGEVMEGAGVAGGDGDDRGYAE